MAKTGFLMTWLKWWLLSFSKHFKWSWNFAMEPYENANTRIVITHVMLIIWATSWENLFMPYANNQGADQPAHLCSLNITFVVHCLDSIIPLLALAKISRPKLISSTEQAGLSLTWSHTSKTDFLVTWLLLHKHLLGPLEESLTLAAASSLL